jgi:signal transduction histidine kinase
MNPRRRSLIVLAGAAVTLFTAFSSYFSPYHLSNEWIWLNIPLLIAVGWSFILVGTMAAARRPENRVGALMIILGFAWFAPIIGLIRTPATYALGVFVAGFYQVVLGHLFVVFPYGRPASHFERRVILGLYMWFILGAAVTMFTSRPTCTGCPSNPVLIPWLVRVSTPAEIATEAITGLLAIAVVAIVISHWRTSSPPARRALAPAFWVAGPTLLVVLAAQLPLFGLPNWQFPAYAAMMRGAQEWQYPPEWLLLLIVPVSFLAGVLRTRLGRGAVGDLVVELSRSPSGDAVEAALATALGDPSLQLLLALPGGGFVDSSGNPLALPEPGARRSVTNISSSGEDIAAVVHDPALNDDPGLVAAAVAAARLAIDNARLQADLKAQLAEVRASRMRIVQAADAERRRVERNLHDGAQQRMLAAALALGVAQRHAKSNNDPELAAVIDEAAGQLSGALEELRELARGVHPAVLTRSGLRPALRSLAERSPIPVEITCVPAGRLPDSVEGTAYFVVCESLANVAKHARATSASVAVSVHEDRLRVEVRDDGVGGADSAAGSGLSGLADRVEALGGRLEICSAPGEGTRIRAELPCG